MGIKKFFKIITRLVQFGCVIHCVDSYVGSFVVCCGGSMMPTLFNNNVILAENVSVSKKKLQKGDIIIARSPTDPRQCICKRLIAMEGDKVWDDNSVLHYIPKGHVWLGGDNHDNSVDSRQYGPVPSGLILRRAFFKVWPLLDIGPLKHPAERW